MFAVFALTYNPLT